VLDRGVFAGQVNCVSELYHAAIETDGEPISSPHPAAIYQPQNDPLFPWLTITRGPAGTVSAG